MSKTDGSSNAKEVESQFTSDSGFLSGFQDSCEIVSSEVVVDNSGGNPADKTEFDSGIVSSELPSAIQITPYIPDFQKETFKRAGQHPALDKYFEQDPNDGFTGLHLAILNCNWQAINTLIALVSDPSYLNIKNFNGQTALHLSCLLNQHLTCRKLINAGIDVNIRDNRCQTALMVACSNENTECVQIILSAVQVKKETQDLQLIANLECWNFSGETCFYIACKLRNVPIARALASVGCNINAREGKCGNTALMNAILAKATEIVAFLCEDCSSLDIDVENYSGLTAYQLCLLTEQDQLAEHLVSNLSATPFFTSYDSDTEYDDSSSDSSFSDEIEKHMLINKIAEIAVN